MPGYRAGHHQFKVHTNQCALIDSDCAQLGVLTMASVTEECYLNLIGIQEAMIYFQIIWKRNLSGDILWRSPYLISLCLR